MSRLLMILLTCLSVVLIGCDSNDPDDEPMVDPTSIAGDWAGVVTSNDVDLPVQMSIMETMTILSGSGTVQLESGPVNFTIETTSSYIHPLVNMFLIFERPPLGTLNGVVSTDRQEIRGTMAGPGFSGAAEFVMQRM